MYFIVSHDFNLNIVSRLYGVFIYIRLTKPNRTLTTCSIPFIIFRRTSQLFPDFLHLEARQRSD